MWEDALKLLDDMREYNVLPNGYTYSSAITACGNCGKWKQSLELLEQVRIDYVFEKFSLGSMNSI